MFLRSANNCFSMETACIDARLSKSKLGSMASRQASVPRLPSLTCEACTFFKLSRFCDDALNLSDFTVCKLSFDWELNGLPVTIYCPYGMSWVEFIARGITLRCLKFWLFLLWPFLIAPESRREAETSFAP